MNTVDNEITGSIINDNSSVIAVKKKTSRKQPDISLSILTRYMKKQNELILKKIAEHKNIEYEKLKLDFLKPSYFTPRIE